MIYLTIANARIKLLSRSNVARPQICGGGPVPGFAPDPASMNHPVSESEPGEVDGPVGPSGGTGSIESIHSRMLDTCVCVSETMLA